MEKMGALERWRLAAVQRHVGTDEEVEAADVTVPENGDIDTFGEWISLYVDGKSDEAESSVNEHLLLDGDRRKNAQLYNDRGYIRYGLQKKDEAKQDLQRALDLHYNQLPLTLSNLAIAYLDEGDYESAIEYILDAMFLTLSAEEVSAGALRFRLPPAQRARKTDWEQHPANVLEASYINLGFALRQSGSREDGIKVLEEGLALMPSSLRLKHALARAHLSANRYDLALPIYQDMAQHSVSDPILSQEINSVVRTAPRRR